MVAARTAATAAGHGAGRRRAPGASRRRVSAAIPERKLATCQAVRLQNLIAAPPVEKSIATPRTWRRAALTGVMAAEFYHATECYAFLRLRHHASALTYLDRDLPRRRGLRW